MKTDEQGNSQWRTSRGQIGGTWIVAQNYSTLPVPLHTRTNWKCVPIARIKAPEELFLSWTFQRGIWTITVFQTECKIDHWGLQGHLDRALPISLVPTHLLSGCKVLTNTGFRKRRGSEPRVLKLNDGKKACKDFIKYTVIFPSKQEKVAFVKRITVLFSEKPKLIMGWPWSSSHNSQAAECPRTTDTSIPQRGNCSYPVFSCLWWILPSANAVTEHHHPNLTLSGTYTATSHFPKHIPAQSNHKRLLWTSGEKPVVENINEAKIVTDETILVLTCEGGETSLAIPHPTREGWRNSTGRHLHNACAFWWPSG